MSLRFRRSVRLFPGVRLNFSRSGISTTVGVRGASMTLGPRGTYANVGLPGSGLSYRTKVSPSRMRATPPAVPTDPYVLDCVALGLAVIAVLAGGGWTFQHRADINRLLHPAAVEVQPAPPPPVIASAHKPVHRHHKKAHHATAASEDKQTRADPTT